MNKIILVDWGGVMFRSIFGWLNRREIKPTYTALTMLIGDLMKVGVNPQDTVILAVDSPLGSWRKEVDPNYKANRKEQRSKYDINWDYMFVIFDDLLQQIDAYTPFHPIVINKLEADDIISYACRKFNDKEVIIISSDSDFEQLCSLTNVRLFSPISKKFKHVSDPYSILAKKIKQETTDNLYDPVITEEDFNKRNMIVNLLSLPTDIEKKVAEKLEFLPEKDFEYEKLPFPTLQTRWAVLYDKNKVVDSTKEKKKRKKKKGGGKKWETKTKKSKRKKVVKEQNNVLDGWDGTEARKED